ncbi:nucleotidyl transferase AbiEii/AbiGii toxin family protein [Candidatus Shapirobacteria bacterium]|nr:nucleotidyl transferase AbiEii/AbiGii toxin family protein [Candidatus Shapirobacteria bacterium]
MITQSQIGELKKYYQTDSFTIFREYLQLLFLNYLYQNEKGGRIYFKGGTAIHFFFSSPRFSEDLDFSTNCDKEEIKKIIEEVAKEMGRELPGLAVSFLYQSQKTTRLRLKYQAVDFKYPFVIRLDFTIEKKPPRILVSPLLTKFPLVFFPIVSHLSAEEILAEKIAAVINRRKGRDLFDLWFLLEKGIKIESVLIEAKLERGRKFTKDGLIRRITSFPERRLALDLDRFLPQSQRKITPVLKERLVSFL